MSNIIPGHMAPLATHLAGFLEEYDWAAYPDVKANLFLTGNYVMHDPDLPAPVQAFHEFGQLRVLRLHFDGYFIAPMRQVAMNPALVFQVVARMVAMDKAAPRPRRLRFWIARRLLAIASRLMTPSGRTDL